MNILQNKNDFFMSLQKEKYFKMESKKDEWKDDEIPLQLKDLDFRDCEETEFDRIEDK